MKNGIITMALVFSLVCGAFAQGGMFQRGPEAGQDNSVGNRDGGLIELPSSHGSSQDSGAPLGGGVLLLAGLGAAYAAAKRRKI